MGPGELPGDQKCVIMIEVCGPINDKDVEVFNRQLKELLDKYGREHYKVEKKYVIRGKKVDR